MSISSRHPLYDDHVANWSQMRHTIEGEQKVKGQRDRYLPPTSGMREDGFGVPNAPGELAYRAYVGRSVFPEVVGDALETMIGVMHYKPATIELPKALEPLLKKATLRNESLQMLLRRINEEQLTTGRVGLMADFPPTPTLGEAMPYLALYEAERIVNWDENGIDRGRPQELNLVVLDETGEERVNDFEWQRVERYRTLVLGDVEANESRGQAVYRVGVFEDDDSFSEADLKEPVYRGRRLDRIPFVFANVKDVTATPDEPPLLGLSNLALAIYRAEADHRQGLFASGQDTLVRIGAQEDENGTRVGAGVVLDLPMGADAKFIGVSSMGLTEQRVSKQSDYERADRKANALVEAVGSSAESGEALKVRVAARTASLNQIAFAGAYALEQILKALAEWMGLNPEEVVVEPNLDFVSDTMKGRELVEIMAAKSAGAPYSLRGIHELMKRKGMTERTFEEELEEMERESEDGLPAAAGTAADESGSTDRNGPEPDGEDEPDDEDEDEGSDA